ncbi:MAG: LPS export ABC transporter periplasmic protein LptC [Deltaproteobacteria bacterium]|nr:LPS export ABC transporter periplasmic protein LptC [Deltaproteobacteria bacterium]
MKVTVKKNYKFKKTRYLILSIIIITPLLIFTVFLRSDNIVNNKEKILDNIVKNVDISLNKIDHIATKDGKKEWVFKSDEVTFSTSKKKAEVKNLYVTFFLKNGSEANITADNGVFNYETNNIEAFGNVIITDGNYILKTKHIFYNNKKKIISSENAVKILGKHFDINANSIILNINQGSAELNGDINAVF